MIIPDAYLPLILGPEYATLARLQEESQAKILVPTMSTPGTKIRIITLTGTQEST